MSDRTLLPVCDENAEGDCFDNSKNHIVRKGCPKGAVCTEAAGPSVLKTYTWVDDATKNAPIEEENGATESSSDTPEQDDGVHDSSHEKNNSTRINRFWKA